MLLQHDAELCTTLQSYTEIILPVTNFVKKTYLFQVRYFIQFKPGLF